MGMLRVSAQVGAPSLRCASVSGNNIILTWVIPADPSGLFTSYEIYSSPTTSGFALVGTVNTYTQNTYTHVAASGSVQSQYYYIKTKSSGGTAVSASSDTLRSVFMNLAAPPSGINTLSWNATKIPLLPSASTTYTVSRENPPNVWTTLYSGSGLNYKDTITKCSIFYNYKIQTSDAQGCISQSNINGGLFFDGQAPLLPLLDSVSINASGLATLGWQSSAPSGAARYVIYKFIAGIWTAIDTVNGGNNTAYTYTNASTGSETFCIAAIDSCKNITILGQGQTTMSLTTAYDLCSRTANLSWSAYGNLPLGILTYEIYCSINGGLFNVIGTSSSSTTFLHPNLNPGDIYCYFIRVKNANQTITASSNRKCLLAKAPSGPTYVYIKSVSVNASSQVEVTYTVDNTKVYKGATILKSTDGGSTFKQIAYQSYIVAPSVTYTDSEVKPNEKNYYYKIQLSDSCGNPGVYSNTSKTILLHVSNDNNTIFYNTLTWDDYSTWSGNVNSYNIYRAVNGVFDPVPITNVFYGIKSYVDNVENFVKDEGKFSYYIQAIEGPGNIYGFKDSARSNIAEAYVEVHVFVPNAFCPKGLNDTWLPIAQYVEKTDYKVIVFDRWGTKVFETTNDTEGWKGNDTKDDVFVYIIEYKNARGEYIQLKGHLNLIR